MSEVAFILQRSRALPSIAGLLFLAAAIAAFVWFLDSYRAEAGWAAFLSAVALFIAVENFLRLGGPNQIGMIGQHVVVDGEEMGVPIGLRQTQSYMAILVKRKWISVGSQYKGDRKSLIDAICVEISQQRQPVAYADMPTPIPDSLNIGLFETWVQMRGKTELGVVAWTGPDLINQRRYAKAVRRFAYFQLLFGIICNAIKQTQGYFLVTLAVFIFPISFVGNRRRIQQSLLIHSEGLCLWSKDVSGEMDWDDLSGIIAVRCHGERWKDAKGRSYNALLLKTHDDAEILIHDQFDVPLQVIHGWISVCSRQ